LGLKLLLDRMEEDKEAALAFTADLKAIFFAGAGIDSVLWNRLKRFRDGYETFEILSGYGATEAASTICLSPAPLESPGELGHPLPGHEICLVEGDGGSELRVRGPNIAPGYLTAEGPRALPLDEAGFYCTGDAAVLRLRNDGAPVFAFDGRLAEDFKLSSGVKVRSGALRTRLLAHCAPLVDDLVVDGENRHALVALFFPAASWVGKEDLVHMLAKAIAAWNEANGGTSTAISHYAIASLPPDRGRGELSDKGQIVRSVYLRNHAGLFAALHEGAGHSPQV
jgi:feruloyl-CoA synthase